MASLAEKIIDLYQRHAHDWVLDRGSVLFEKHWLDRFLALTPPQASILDIGCGSAEPVTRYFIEKECQVTGADASTTLIDICRAVFQTTSGSWRTCGRFRCPALLMAFSLGTVSSIYVPETNARCFQLSENRQRLMAL